MRIALWVLAAAVGVGCGGNDDPPTEHPGSGGTPGALDPFDVPIPGISSELEAAFNDGDFAFSNLMRTADGLGPLYTRAACDACHSGGLRGPGAVQKMSVVEADGVTPAADQSKLLYGHTVHPLATGAGITPILPPAGDSSVKVTTRVGPPVIGRGYIEAVLDSEIERVAQEQAARSDSIKGRINRVTYDSESNVDQSFHAYQKGDSVIGRFGLKARIGTLDDFAADAFQGDMGITSPLRPNEFANPDSLVDDQKPGPDVSYESVNSRAMYLRLLAIPPRYASEAGREVFGDTLCSACHVESLRTRADYPIANLAGIDAPIYSDLLLHEMGSELADGLPASPSTDGEAGSFQWRTAPLIGVRFNRTFLHDGRAQSIEDAIRMHRGPGSEANESVDRFDALDDARRKLLVDFVGGL